jgi:hypothetical protein
MGNARVLGQFKPYTPNKRARVQRGRKGFRNTKKDDNKHRITKETYAALDAIGRMTHRQG